MADVLISALTPVVTLGPTDLFEIEQGVDPANASLKATLAQLEAYTTAAALAAAQAAITPDSLGVVKSVVAGSNVTVDNTDPRNPIVSASGGGGGSSVWGRTVQSFILSNYGTTTLSSNGFALTATGTLTAGAVSNTDFVTQQRRVDYRVSAAVNAVAGFRSSQPLLMIGNVAGQGGFTYICRWFIGSGATNTSSRVFTGLTESSAAPTDVEPSSLLSMIGVGWDSADTNIQIMRNDGAGTATKIDLGASYPVPTVNASTIYELELSCTPNSSTVTYIFRDVGQNIQTTGSFSTDLPAAGTMLYSRGYASAGGVSTLMGMGLCHIWMETR